MRVLTWNVHRRNPGPTWSYIHSYLQPDVAFVQEAPRQKKPELLSDWLWSEIGENSRWRAKGKYHWASGVGVFTGRLEPLVFEGLGSGWVVAARLAAGDRMLTLINGHMEYGQGLFATTSLHKVIDAVAPQLSGDDVILGGDLNVDPLWDDLHATRRHREVLKRLTDLGLFHVNTLLPKGTRTNRVSKHPYQIDHFFVSESLREIVRDVRVIVGSGVAVLSDHYPLLLDLDLPHRPTE